MDIANVAEDGDITLENDDLKIFLAKDADIMLSGATIDFSDEQGFAIMGMNQDSCSCQNSSDCQ
jgi:Fe-S cluster assembly iron-binding protein IscA